MMMGIMVMITRHRTHDNENNPEYSCDCPDRSIFFLLLSMSDEVQSNLVIVVDRFRDRLLCLRHGPSLGPQYICKGLMRGVDLEFSKLGT